MNRLSLNRAAVADWATVIMAVCAIVMAGFAVRQHLRRPSGVSVEDSQVENWDEYVAGGRRIGPENASVTIVEFGDYQCPFCGRLEPVLRTVLVAYPDEVALVYRHMPLSYHEHAYQAARLAECAGDQERFRQAHTRLYALEDLDAIDPREFGASVGVEDLASFVECAGDRRAVPGIERDLAAAEEFEITSTPTMIVNGLRLGRTPDSVRLFELVRSTLSGEKATAGSR